MDISQFYLDIYDTRGNSDSGISVLDDIDFELELLRNNNINVDFIIKLLEDLDYESSSFDK